MAKQSELNAACDRVIHNGKVAQRLWGGSFIEVLTLDAESRKVLSVNLDRMSKTVTFKTFDRLLGRDTESTTVVLNYRQTNVLADRLEAEFWPETAKLA